MKKILTLTTILIIGLGNYYLYAQKMTLSATFTDDPNTRMYDARDGYAIGGKGNNIRVFKRNAQGGYDVIHDDLIPEGMNKATMNVQNGIIVALIETPQRILGKRLTPSGSTHVAQTVDLTSMNGATAHHMVARRYPHGLSFIHEYKWSSNGLTSTKIGTFNFDGSFLKNIAVYDTSHSHKAIISDNNTHYVFSYWGTEVFMEKRNNDANLSYNNGYFLGPLYTSNTDVTDVMQTDTTIRVLVRHYPDSIIEKIIWKSNGVSTELRIPYAVSPTTDHEEYIFPTVLMAREKIIQHTPDPYGNSTITNTTTFPAGYTKFTSFPVSNYFFIWVGYGKDAHVILMDEWLSAKQSLTIGGGSDAVVMKGGYQQDQNTFILYGDRTAGGTTHGVIYTLSMENITTEVAKVSSPSTKLTQLYPNPARNVLHIECAKHEKISNVVIYDMLGNTVRIFEGSGTSEQSVSLYRLSSADYIVEIMPQSGISIRKKIVKL